MIKGGNEMKKEIFIDTAGREVRARLFEDEVLICNAVAKCHPEDEFDICTGAEIAIDRLKEKYQKIKEGDKYKQFADGKFCIYTTSKNAIKTFLGDLNCHGFTWSDGSRLLDYGAPFYRDTYYGGSVLFRAIGKKINYLTDPVTAAIPAAIRTKTVYEFEAM
jgi:hypothetical protein